MVPKKVFATVICMVLLALNGAALADESRADQYKADQFLGLDLSTAVLSPKLLGPTTEFTPFSVEANTGPETSPAVTPKAASRIVIPRMKVEQARREKPRRAAPTRLARSTKPALSHGNPLDAQASDTRVQVWPCKSGGICNWQR